MSFSLWGEISYSCQKSPISLSFSDVKEKPGKGYTEFDEMELSVYTP